MTFGNQFNTVSYLTYEFQASAEKMKQPSKEKPAKSKDTKKASKTKSKTSGAGMDHSYADPSPTKNVKVKKMSNLSIFLTCPMKKY